MGIILWIVTIIIYICNAKLINPLMESLLKKHFGIYQYYLSVNKNKLMGYSINWGGYLFQRQLVSNQTVPLKDKSIHPERIPLFELNNTIGSVAPPIDLLVVNCNPAGTDYRYYNGHQLTGDIGIYDNPHNKYLRWGAELFPQKQVATIDVFPIVCQKQDLIKKAAATEIDLFSELLGYFWELVWDLHPRALVVTNAFVKKILSGETNLNPSNNPQVMFDNDRVCHWVQFPDSD